MTFKKGDRVRALRSLSLGSDPAHVEEGRTYTVMHNPRKGSNFVTVDCCERHAKEDAGWYQTDFELPDKVNLDLFGKANRIMKEKLNV